MKYREPQKITANTILVRSTLDFEMDSDVYIAIILFYSANFFLSILESNILQYQEQPKSVPPKNEAPGTAKKIPPS